MHSYRAAVAWSGSTGVGYDGYDRRHAGVSKAGFVVPLSSDAAFLGDPACLNPEELLVASLPQCHMLWYLVLCAKEGIVVTDYVDHATGTLVETPDGSGHFEEVTLHPQVTIASGQHMDRATELHARAHDMCFVANSVNFDVRTEPAIVASGDAATASGS